MTSLDDELDALRRGLRNEDRERERHLQDEIKRQAEWEASLSRCWDDFLHLVFGCAARLRAVNAPTVPVFESSVLHGSPSQVETGARAWILNESGYPSRAVLAARTDGKFVFGSAISEQPHLAASGLILSWEQSPSYERRYDGMLRLNDSADAILLWAPDIFDHERAWDAADLVKLGTARLLNQAGG